MKHFSISLLFIFLYHISSAQTTGYRHFKTWKDFLLSQNEAISKIEIGMAKEQVLDSIGKLPAKIQQTFTGELLKGVIPQPAIRDFWKSAGTSIEIFWIYTNTITSDGNFDKNECTPIFFENNKLVGVGSMMLEEYIKSKKAPSY